MSLAFVWIPRYYETVFYRLTENEIVWRRGVWFKTTGIVPYNRITNIDVTQWPLSRRLKVASLKIQTAGYSAQKTSAEIRIECVENYESLRETIMNYIKSRKPQAVETYEEKVNDRILEEVTKIRQLLEGRSKK
ncbi:MAG: PH domain-containing protein [Nitrososphaeria archaeon]